MKSIHSVECKLVVAIIVVHFLLIVKNKFTIPNRLTINFVTVIAEVVLDVVEICPLLGLRQLCRNPFEHNRLAKASSIMPA